MGAFVKQLGSRVSKIEVSTDFELDWMVSNWRDGGVEQHIWHLILGDKLIPIGILSTLGF